ncbi:fluoride efflux transporter FluC [Kocuria sp.]|uniref:fluoride efflux transporter FluC n=1 Tax=Kocuria sp. TaxID=1871328 RepID=UPI0026DF01E7|nr:CrcB family protein [Kocuria sp.]MDO5618149.1 CrcB family protein [Kocuria sp.]
MLLAASAGGLGAAARFVVDGEIRLRWHGALPLSTLLINLMGSLLLGLTVGLAGAVISPAVVAFQGAGPGYAWSLTGLAVVGFCGGFTTFSTAMFEVTQLFYQRKRWLAAAYLTGSALAAVAAVVVGMTLGMALQRV